MYKIINDIIVQALTNNVISKINNKRILVINDIPKKGLKCNECETIFDNNFDNTFYRNNAWWNLGIYTSTEGDL